MKLPWRALTVLVFVALLLAGCTVKSKVHVLGKWADLEASKYCFLVQVGLNGRRPLGLRFSRKLVSYVIQRGV